ncbi:MAG: alpha/beta fold hydrolase [Anderseniella sp.]
MREPLLLIPGLMCTGDLFTPQIKAFSGDRETIVADHTGADTMHAIAGRILADAPERFALAGLSMGAYLALEIMSVAPERVSRLALLDGKARLDTADELAARHALLSMADEGRYLNITLDVLLTRLVAAGRALEPDLRETIVQMARDTGVAVFRQQMMAVINRPSYLAGLPDISCPALVLTGSEDVITPPECAQEMAEQIPNARLELISGCGHLSTLEAPDAVNDAMRHWLG